MTEQSHIRNVAIIAHVDHGKTTLVDQLFKQSGLFRENQKIEERLMDSMDLERERGITIMSKNGACRYKDFQINIIDTPGHADFGGEVERVLHMADGALFLVDAAEGPMPQSLFVLKKAIARKLPVIVVVNKIDKPMARPDWVIDQVFDLMVKLEAPDELLDFPILYASAKEGWATDDHNKKTTDVSIIFEKITKFIPAPNGNANGPVQLLISSLNYSVYLGRLAIGKVTSGTLKLNQDVVVSKENGMLTQARINKLYQYQANQQVEATSVSTGDIVAVAGIEDIRVGDTVTDPTTPIPLPRVTIDPPTITMTFLPNDSPFAGKEGTFVTSRHLRDRLFRELLGDVALNVEELPGEIGFKVSGRGELHLSIFIEKIRREGYEFQVSRPQVIYKRINGKIFEPFEDLTITVHEEYMGRVIESLGTRKGLLQEMNQEDGLVKLKYIIPTRGLLGYYNEFMTETKGMGVLNYVFLEYKPFAGEIKSRRSGVLISKETCQTIAYALFNLQERGRLLLGPGIQVYEGQIVGEHCREDDLTVNPAKGKKLTNMRASGSDENVMLIPPMRLSLEQCLNFIADDELVEITPKSIRLRKIHLTENARKQAGKIKETVIL